MSHFYFFIVMIFSFCFSSFSFLVAQESFDMETVRTEFRVVLAPRYSTTLSAEVSSSVKKITKEMGDAFETGELLIQLDDTIFRAVHKKAQFLLDRADEQLAAKKQLFEDNIASAFELKDAQAQVAVAELDLQTAVKELEACSIRAPYQGHMDDLLVNEHEIVQAGQPLVEVVNDRLLLAKLLVPSYYFNKLRVGQKVRIDIKETGQPAEAIVTHVGAVIDPASSMLKIFAEVNNYKGELRAGMTGITKLTP